MMRVSLLLLWALVMAAAAPAQALPPSANAGGTAAPAPVVPANPYSATVPVAGTSDAQRNAAIAAALAQVLQQVSPGFAASPDELASASGYVRDFHYRRAASGNGLELQVDFDAGAVGRLIAAKPSGGAAAGAAAAVAGTLAPTAAQGGSGTLWVDGIDDSPAFVSLLSALRGDGALHDVVPIGATGDGVLLHLGFDQPLTTVLAGLIASNAHLSVDAQPHPGADASLHWTP